MLLVLGIAAFWWMAEERSVPPRAFPAADPEEARAVEKPKDDDVNLRIRGRANWPFAKVDINAKDDAKTWQIRDQEALVKAVGKEGAAQVAKLFKVEAIDFKKHMIIAVSAGTKASGGYRVEITDVLKVEADKQLTVRCILH